MAGSFIDRTDAIFDDLGRREVINLRCRCGRQAQIAPRQLAPAGLNRPVLKAVGNVKNNGPELLA
jgi:hypothetical protein